ARGFVDPLRKCLSRRKHFFLGCLKKTVKATHHDKGKDDLSIFRLFEVASQNLGYRPDESTQILDFNALLCHFSPNGTSAYLSPSPAPACLSAFRRADPRAVRILRRSSPRPPAFRASR